MIYKGKTFSTTGLKKPHRENRELRSIQKCYFFFGVESGRDLGIWGKFSVHTLSNLFLKNMNKGGAEATEAGGLFQYFTIPTENAEDGVRRQDSRRGQMCVF